MAYTPINWQTGDTITADKLNKMDNGWAVESSLQQLFIDTATTTIDPEYPDDGAWDALAYSTPITADTLIVTFDGVDYTCPKTDSDGGFVYGGYSNGAPDFTNFPFAIFSSEFMGNVENNITTASAGTYAVSASAILQSIETSPTFETAVNSVVDTSTMPMECVSGVTTWADMQRAYGNGRILFFRPYRSVTALKYITDFTDTSVNYTPEDTQIRVSITNGIFSVTTV